MSKFYVSTNRAMKIMRGESFIPAEENQPLDVVSKVFVIYILK